MYYNYRFRLGGVLLPVPPESLSRKIKNNNKTLQLANYGEINFLKTPGLTDLEFEILLPHSEYSFATYEDGFKEQRYYLDHFEKIKNSKEPVEFYVAKWMPNGNFIDAGVSMLVSLEEYTISDDFKLGYDMMVKLKLKQYVRFATKKATFVDETSTVVTEERAEGENSPQPKTDTTYTVQSGDTLTLIAKKLYDDTSRYVDIYDVNKHIIKDPNIISVGQVLTIPSK